MNGYAWAGQRKCRDPATSSVATLSTRLCLPSGRKINRLRHFQTFACTDRHACSAGDGHVSRISCPYHSWTYELDGQLIGAPFMQETAGFETKNYSLNELACEVWEGFIYVALGDEASINRQAPQ